jgi:hypothetical protein
MPPPIARPRWPRIAYSAKNQITEEALTPGEGTHMPPLASIGPCTTYLLRAQLLTRL